MDVDILLYAIVDVSLMVYNTLSGNKRYNKARSRLNAIG